MHSLMYPSNELGKNELRKQFHLQYFGINLTSTCKTKTTLYTDNYKILLKEIIDLNKKTFQFMNWKI